MVYVGLTRVEAVYIADPLTRGRRNLNSGYRSLYKSSWTGNTYCLAEINRQPLQSKFQKKLSRRKVPVSLILGFLPPETIHGNIPGEGQLFDVSPKGSKVIYTFMAYEEDENLSKKKVKFETKENEDGVITW